MDILSYSKTCLLLVSALATFGCFAPDQTVTSTETDQGSSSGDPTGTEPTTRGTSSSASTNSDGGTTGASATAGMDTTTTTSTTGDESGTTTTGGPSSEGSSSGPESESSTGAEPVTCGDGGVCVPAIPDGWNGPVATRTIGIDEEIPPCGGGVYTDLQVSDAFAGLQGEDYTCDCDCAGQPLGCEADAALQLSAYPPLEGLSPCTSPNYVYDETIVSGAPQAVSIPMADIRGIVLEDEPTPSLTGSCAPNATVEPMPAGFDTRTIACGTFDAVSKGCDDGLCVPLPTAPYQAGVCVWAEGDLECPAGFDDRSLYNAEYSDTRDCSTCTCGAPTGACEDQSIRIRGWCEDGICFGGSCGPGGTFPCEEELNLSIEDLSTCGVVGAPDFCTPLCGAGEICASCVAGHTLQELRDITYDAGTASASCSPSGGTPEGGVAGIEPTTICCAA